MAGFTKGPWVVRSEPHATGFSRQITPAESRSPIARIVGDPRPGPENSANARLIAAAPELYAECESAALALDEAVKLLAAKGLGGCASIMAAHAGKCRGVLAKARGECPKCGGTHVRDGGISDCSGPPRVQHPHAGRMMG